MTEKAIDENIKEAAKEETSAAFAQTARIARLLYDGTLVIYVDDYSKVRGVLVREWGSQNGALFHKDTDRPPKVVAQVTFDEEKLREIVKEAVERFKEEYEIADRPQGKWKAKSFHEYFCHNCGFSFDAMKCEFLENMKYCPNCGVPKGADDEVDSAPSIDICFCKDCKHRPVKEDVDGDNYGFNLIEPTEDDDRCPCLVDDGWYSWMPEDDFYCGYGERDSEKLNNSTTEQSPVVGKE